MCGGVHTDTPVVRITANLRTHAGARTRVTPTGGGSAPVGLRPPYAPPTCGNTPGRANLQVPSMTRILAGCGEKVGTCCKKVAESFGGFEKNAYLCRRSLTKTKKNETSDPKKPTERRRSGSIRHDRTPLQQLWQASMGRPPWGGILRGRPGHP